MMSHVDGLEVELSWLARHNGFFGNLVLSKGEWVLAVLGSGDSFGKFRIIKVLGRGGMGVVYLAEDELLARCVALKVLDRAISNDDKFETRFKQEARVVASLDHANIIQILSLEHVGDDFAICMPYIEHGSLADALGAGSEPFSQTLLYMYDVLQALCCCHESSIVHRDIKPANILMGTDGRVLLSDFGLAKVLAEYQGDSLRRTASSGFFMGTPQYSPPESWDGAEPSPAWDVYAVGMMLYEAATGSLPYDAKTPLALVKQIAQRPIPKLTDIAPGVSQELSDVVAAALEPDPEKRLQSAGEMLERLRAVPEMAALRSSEFATERIALPANRARKRRAVAVRLSRVRYPLGKVAFVVIVVLIGAWALLDLLRFAGESNWRPASGNAVSGGNDAPVVFDAIEPDAQESWTRQCMMIPGPGRNESSFLAWHDTKVWLLRAQRSGGDLLDVTGDWGEYTGSAARIFRYGTLAGKGRWTKPGEQLTLSLTLTSAQDASRRRTSLVLNVSAQQETQAEFVDRFEISDYGQPILYNELLPRSAAWVPTVEKVFLSRAAGVVKVPRLEKNDTPPTIDGRLDENMWRGFASTMGPETGVLPSQAGDESDILIARYAPDALYLALRSNANPSRFLLRMAVMTRFFIPVTASPHWLVEVDENGIDLDRYYRAGQEKEWACPWTVASATSARGWEAEVRIPFDGFEGDPAPLPGTRWRLLCSLLDASKPNAQVVASWGGQEPKDIECGALLIFE